MPRFRTVLFSLLALALLQPAPAQAQRGWEVSVLGEVGYLITTRDMGKNTGQLQQEQNVQILTHLDDALTVTAGVAVGIPRLDATIRARFRTTVDAKARGQAAVCELFVGDICREVPIEVDVQSFIVDARFVRGNQGDLVRPVLSGGFAVRRFVFGDLFDCPLQDPSGWGPDICVSANEVYQESSPSLGLIFGFGFQSDLGPLSIQVNGEPEFTRYSGGISDASGTTMIDVGLSFSAQLKVF